MICTWQQPHLWLLTHPTTAPRYLIAAPQHLPPAKACCNSPHCLWAMHGATTFMPHGPTDQSTHPLCRGLLLTKHDKADEDAAAGVLWSAAAFYKIHSASLGLSAGKQQPQHLPELHCLDTCWQSDTCLRAAWLKLHYLLCPTGLVWGPDVAAGAAQLRLHCLLPLSCLTVGCETVPQLSDLASIHRSASLAFVRTVEPAQCLALACFSDTRGPSAACLAKSG